MSAGQRLTGGDLVAQALRAAGVEKVFALHGGHLEALFKGCVDQGIELIDFRHEAAAGHAADAYARTSGKLGVCAVTAGPGFANAIAAIANAQLDGSPVLFIVGAPPLREVETNPLQGGIDQIAIARPVAKWAISVPATERMADLTAMAIRKAMSGHKGAVVLELPIDVLHMSLAAHRATPPAGVTVQPRPAPSPGEVARLTALLAQAERPVILAGMEAANERAAAAIRRLADTLKIPVFAKTQAMGVLPAGHPANGGAPRNLAIMPLLGTPRPDLVVLLGARLGLLLGGRSGAIVPHAAKLAQVYADPAEIGRIRDVDLAICADAAEAAEALTAAAAAAANLPDFTAWRDRAVAVGKTPLGAPPPEETAGGIHPFHAAAVVARVAGDEAQFVFDGGEAASWGADAVAAGRPAQVLGHGYLGCLGIGPGFSIGAQVAQPGRRVAHLTGDGAMGFHLQEFDTMVRRGLPIVTVVLNNQVWGMSIHGQQLMFGANYNVITKLGATRYADIAAAFGCHGERVTAFKDLEPALRRAFDSGRPALVEVMTDPDVVHPVTVSMLGQVAEGSQDVMIPYYENIPAGVS